MTRYVIDASVLIKLVVPEDNSEKMRALTSSFRMGTVRLLAPDFIFPECANVLWKYAKRTHTPQEEIQEAFRVLGIRSGHFPWSIPLATQEGIG